jgi:hypothetical protein
MSEQRLTSWIDWYRFARETLGSTHPEAVVYATVRAVEDANRQRLLKRRAAWPALA